jgi:LacI family transcriptional regulator
VPLREIAERAGVSTAGVSLALRDHPRISEPTRKRVQRVARELGYAPAPRKSASDVVWRFGFVYCDARADEITSAEFEPSLRLFMRDSLALRARFELLLIDDNIDSPDTRRKLQEFAAHLQGVLLYGLVHTPTLELLKQMDRPAVVMGETDVPHDKARDLNLQRVTDDPMQSGLIATEHLLRRGRRRIAFVGGIRTPGFFYERWYDGYLLAHAKAAVPIVPELVMWHDVGNPLSERIGAFAAPTARPDAIVWPGGDIAASLRPRLSERGLQLDPQDEVIGAMSHSPALKGQEHYPQVLGDLAAMTEEAIRRLQAVCRHGVNRAVSIVVPDIIRNIS